MGHRGSRSVAQTILAEGTVDRIRRAEQPAPAGASRPRLAGSRAAEAGLLVGLGALALALRLPHVQTIPIFTDEIDDLSRALLTARGRLVPLTDTSSYIGSLWDWLAAGAFRLSGYSLYAPRALMLGIGVLTILAAYPLGRAWGGRVGGLLGAGLLGTSATHIAVNSHVAWSNCATPLFTTLGAWALHGAVRPGGRAGGGWLLGAGLCWGLGLQTHPSVLALLPGGALFLLWRGRPLLRTRWAAGAAGLFALANLNLIAYNLASGFDSLAFAMKVSHEYTRGQQLTPGIYAERLGYFWVGLLRHLGGAIDWRERGDAGQILWDPGLWPMGAAAAAGLAWQWRRGNPLPALLLAGMALILPLFDDQRSQLILDGRFIGPLLPVLYAGVGALFAVGLGCLRAAGGGWRTPGRAGLGQACLGLATAYLLLHPLLYLRTYYDQVPQLGDTNAALFDAVEAFKANRRAGEMIIVDRLLQNQRAGPGGTRLASAFGLALAVNDLPYRLMDLGGDALLDPATRCRDLLVVAASREPEASAAMVARLELRGLDDGPAGAQNRAGLYPVYRLARLPDAGASC